MMEITINVPGLKELAEALSQMAGSRERAVPQQGTAAPTVPTSPTVPTAPVAQPVPTPTPSVAAPMAQPSATGVPVTAKTYTADELAKAAMMLMDAGKQQQLVQLLQNFGVESLPALAPEQYGAFATALRGLGAQI